MGCFLVSEVPLQGAGFEERGRGFQIVPSVRGYDLAWPLETQKVRILHVGMLDLCGSRGAVGHALPDIRGRVTERLKGGGREWLLRKYEFYEYAFS